MAHVGYVAKTEAQVASAAAGTPKTILCMYAPAQFGIDLQWFHVDFDGVTATEKPPLVEIVRFTGVDGTGTGVTVFQDYGRVITPGFVAKRNYTSEPATPEVLREWALDPNKGFVEYDWPLGRTLDCDISDGFGIRVTVPSGGLAVNMRAELGAERT